MPGRPTVDDELKNMVDDELKNWNSLCLFCYPLGGKRNMCQMKIEIYNPVLF